MATFEQKIEELKALKKAEEHTELSLSGVEAVNKLQFLHEFKNLEFLSLKECSLTNLKSFPKLQQLKVLDLSSNSLAGTLFFLAGCPNMTHLNLSHNKIAQIVALKPLGKLKNLQSLLMTNNIVAEVNQYRKRIFKICKNLEDLDGISKSPADLEPLEEVPKGEDDPMDGTQKSPKRPKKRKQPVEIMLIPKKQKTLDPLGKNALMYLNELKPGLQYTVESFSGPSHNPEFIVSVMVNEQKFIGKGTSKQLAKHNAADNALRSFVQFKNMPAEELMTGRRIGVDFSRDDIENQQIEMNIQKNGSNILGRAGAKKKVTTEADKKNPVMLLNEMHPGLEYELLTENSAIPSQRFCMTVVVNGESYEGFGPNKKQAKAAAARAVLSHSYNVNYNLYATTMPVNEEDKELFNFPQTIADKISRLLTSTFSDVMLSDSEHAKWKIIAGVAMTKDEAMQDVQIITLGTGTKCISGQHISMVGANLNDCHAEIISRRCLKDFFYTNLELHLEGEGDQSIFMRRSKGGFCLRPNIKFHLYISTAPCGDARIFSPHEEGIGEGVDRHPNRNSRGVLRTKIESGEGTIPIKPGQAIQTWDGILPGQERLLTMSCSDKIAMWNAVGFQGALLSYFIEPVYLESVVLGGLFHPNHLKRALMSRFENSLSNLPGKYRLNKPKMCVVSSPETRHVTKSPNWSVNWTTGLGRAEVVNATTGKTDMGQVSRLSKRSFFQRFMNICDRLPHVDKYTVPQPGLYSSYKAAVMDYQDAKKALMKAFLDAGLGQWVKKPAEQNDFELVF